METDRKALLANFMTALGELTTPMMKALETEKLRGLAEALMSGAARVQFAIDTDPLIIIAYLRGRTDATQMQELFRIDASSPTEKFQ